MKYTYLVKIVPKLMYNIHIQYPAFFQMRTLGLPSEGGDRMGGGRARAKKGGSRRVIINCNENSLF
jgi:hypothetical protein